MSVKTYICSVLVACLSYVLYNRLFTIYPSLIVKPDKRYDYIIVGAGTAGCVLASRLTEDPHIRVLLIEAGDHMGYFTRIPLTATAAQLGPNDWSVRTTPQKFSSFGLWDQTQLIPRGKGPGGSGQINFLLHGFGLPEDFHRWSQLGFKGWTADDLKPYFLKAFGTDSSEFDSTQCSSKGYCPGSKAPMKLKRIDEQDELTKTFKSASLELQDKDIIFRRPTATVKDGARLSTFGAYLKPSLYRKNLHVLLKTQAISIRFDNTTASSVYILKNNRELDNIFVNNEIILAAGAIKTPQILMLSGIGHRDLIKKLRVKFVSHNKYVGRNLHDHMNMPLYVTIQRPISVTLSKVFTVETVWDYYWNGKGLLSFPPVAGLEYQNSSALMLFSMGSATERLLREVSNYKPQVFRDTYPFHNISSTEGFMFLATCAQSRSRGSVTLRDSSTTVPPVVDPNYLEQRWDVECMIKALRRAEALISTKPFQDIGARIHWPRPERCLSFWKYTKEDQIGPTQKKKRRIKRTVSIPSVRSNAKKSSKVGNKTRQLKPMSPPDEYMECLIREVAVTGHHVGGTCAGGTVVDDQLRVKSVSGLRIVDASVLPSPVSLYPNSVIVGMAEKAADMIRNRSVSI